MTDLSVHLLVALAGIAAGTAFGALAQRTNFCTMGAISDAVVMGDMRRLRAWVAAIAVALLGATALHAAGAVDLGKSIYLTPNLGWSGAIFGGAVFGFGMVLAGGCGQRNLVRAGAGNLKSWVVLILLGISAYATLRGIVGAARVATWETTNLDLRALGFAGQGLPELLGVSRVAIGAILAAALLAWCFKDREFRASARDVAAGLGIGASIVAGWAITGVLGADDFEPTPLASFTFVAPVGDALVYLMFWTGSKITFGAATVAGVILGAGLAAKASGTWRLESFRDTSDFLRTSTGAVMMGIGGVSALGCTVGQGITGLSTLALGSFLAVVGIVAGAVLALKYLEEGSLAGAVKALAARG
ncbi:MAG: YeeE/YedE family protein [Tagaea sp.]|nr:YeeE/YedE family protein [Tagaea sp.]